MKAITQTTYGTAEVLTIDELRSGVRAKVVVRILHVPEESLRHSRCCPLQAHAEHVGSLSALGFGFLELGGVTPRPQPGNPRPRLFRIPEANAIINRYGLNSVGVDRFVSNLSRFSRKCIIGVNIGKNKDTPNEKATDDYELCFERLYPHVDYVTLNVSSPNTAGLRDLQNSEALSSLLSRMKNL